MFSTLVQAQRNANGVQQIELNITSFVKSGLCAFRTLNIIAPRPGMESTLLKWPLITN